MDLKTSWPTITSRRHDVEEVLRFLVAGVLATAGNLAATRIARLYWDYNTALGAGLAVGITISFVLSKLFAFRSRELRRTPGELARFVLVWGGGALIYWRVSLLVGRDILPRLVDRPIAESLGVLAGASVMMVTSYLGHRFFTYRDGRRTERTA